MSSPTADLPVPVAVLVLAWDEATPAVRALVEATRASTPTVDSLLVMVPQADAPDRFSAEEYLPLALPEAEIPAPATESNNLIFPASFPTPASALLPAASEAAPPLAGEKAAQALLALPVAESLAGPGGAPAASGPAAPLAWAAVRILRLGGYSLPQLAQRAGQPLPAPAWTGASTLPTAPYLGAAPLARLEPALAQETAPTLLQALPTAPLASAPALPSGPPQPATESAPVKTADLSLQASELLLEATTEPRPQAADLEADVLLAELAEAEANEQTTASPDPLAADELAPTLPEQASWPEALATLRQPAAPLELVPEPSAARGTHPALRPAAAHYPAPDLNFQIIQYARFAVPVALAEAPFAVIYAPAWPTWLAAQELRYRTGRPLVLHVAELAAAADESVEVATGWIAELQRQALHRADLLLTETPALAQRLRHELGLRAELVQAIPAADTAAIAQALHAARVRPAA